MRNAKLGFCGVLSLAAAAVAEAAPIDIGSRLEVFWDDYLVDTNLTTPLLAFTCSPSPNLT